jgi:hypothetical protein
VTTDRDRLGAGLALISLAVVLCASLWVPVSSSPPDSGPSGVLQGDPALFSVVVGRLRAGQSYYRAMGEELRLKDFPTASVFNWRMPALYVAMASTPRGFPPALMIGLSILLLTLLMIHLTRQGSL